MCVCVCVCVVYIPNKIIFKKFTAEKKREFRYVHVRGQGKGGVRGDQKKANTRETIKTRISAKNKKKRRGERERERGKIAEEGGANNNLLSSPLLPTSKDKRVAAMNAKKIILSFGGGEKRARQRLLVA